ncbi:hypothetical protein V2J09_019980 [Rumex salicifolius]
MAESTQKRQRDNKEEEETEFYKRHKSYELIFSILEEDEDVSTDDLSSLITSLEQEISSSSSSSDKLSAMDDQISSPELLHPSVLEYTHLLEASDDELGIPNHVDTVAIDEDESNRSVSVDEIDGGDLLFEPELLWEVEDETANYYALLQSQLFLQWV